MCLLAMISPAHPKKTPSFLYTKRRLPPPAFPASFLLFLLDGLKVAIHNWHQGAELQSLRLLLLQECRNKEEVFGTK